jgi:hypothetical protein
MLDQESARDMAGVVHRKADQARDLLRLAEEILRGIGQRMAFERDDTLVPLPGELVEGDRQITLAEQGLERRNRGHIMEPVGVEAHIAAKLALAEIADQQVDDSALGLRLHRQLTAHAPEHRSQQCGERQRLGQDPRDRRRIVMRRQHLVEQRTDSNDSSARRALRDREPPRQYRALI